MSDERPVLVVEDDDAVRSEIIELIRSLGYPVIGAATGEAALRTILEGDPLRLVVLDLYIPGVAGWDVLEVVRSYVRFSDLPVLIVSGVPEYGLTMRYPGTRFLAKPLRPEALERAVGEMCRSGSRRLDDSSSALPRPE